jgi:hypothetical protein
MDRRTRTLAAVAALALGTVVAGCQTNPKQTVLNLDTTDRKWSSPRCVAARKAVHRYNDGERLRAAAGLANYVTPYVGTAVSTLLNLGKDPERERLNAIVRAECVSPPKPERQRAGRSPGPPTRLGRY